MPRERLSPEERKLNQKRLKDFAVGTGLGFLGAIAPELGAVILSGVESVHPVIALAGLGLRGASSRDRKPPKVTFSAWEKARLFAQDTFTRDRRETELLNRSLDRWEGKQYARLDRDERASKRRMSLNRVTLVASVPESFIPLLYVPLTKVPHSVHDNFFQAVTDTVPTFITNHAQYLPHLNLLDKASIGLGAASLVAAVIAVTFRNKAERKYQAIVEDEKDKVHNMRVKYYEDHLAGTTHLERVVDGAAGILRRKKDK